MTRADRLELVRQLRVEGLSQRAIAKRLKVSKDTVRRDFDLLDAEDAPGGEPGDEPPTSPDDPGAPQVTAGDRPESEADGAPGDEPPGEPVAQLPRREPGGRLVVDLAGRSGLRRDLADLGAHIDRSPQDLVEMAVHALAVGYRQGVKAGDVLPGRPFQITRVSVASLGLPGRRIPAMRTAPAAPDGGGQ
ncbi:hypothetical protein ACH4C6_07495 [Streptomyces sp. NPDC017943]|uniref:hypothetical protein n=1 Tax=Streptomyces sp. NPDC017943 TaxID=3365019 RepID=UPI0037A46289